MPETILYLTSRDADLLREWLNRETSVAWIVKARQSGCDYGWRAVDTIDALPGGHYCLWNKEAGPLNIPSGSPDVPDALVEDPYAGWNQHLDHENASAPWFGAGLPRSYWLRFKPDGREAQGAIGRSGVGWVGDRYRMIGKPAPLTARRWWNRLGRFVRSHSTAIPWPSPSANTRMWAYAVPDAFGEIMSGRARDVNP